MGTSEKSQGVGKSTLEIERKFLVRQLPEVVGYPVVRILQGYVAIEEGGTEVRVRSKDDADHTLTIKSKGGMVRGEYETPITADQFATLWPTTEGRRVEKDRYAIPHGRHTIELDKYVGSLAGLVVAEVEFETEADAEGFTPPDWMGEDVTDLKELKNQQLALHGAPEWLEMHE
jgi:CYTH domain-containing protein